MKRTLYLILTFTLLFSAILLSPSGSAAREAAAQDAEPAGDGDQSTANMLPSTLPHARWLPPTPDSPQTEMPDGSAAPDAVTLGGDWSNTAAWACITPLGAIYNTAFGAGLVALPPWDLPAQFTEYTANLALKFCGPVLWTPYDVMVNHQIDENDRCSWTFDQPRRRGKFKNFLGVTLPWGDVFPGKQWGDLGEPFVFHWNTHVDVGVDMRPAQALGNNRYRLPLGNHTLTWRADTLMSPLDLVWTYVPGAAWAKLAKMYKLKEVTVKAGSQTTDAVINLIGGELPFIYSWPTMYNEEVQQVAVIDQTAPYLSGPAHVQLEATEPGGLSRQTYLYHLQRNLTVSDNCDAAPKLIAENADLPEFVAIGDGGSVTWVAEDQGPRDFDGAVNRSQPLVQTFVLTDTLAPIVMPPPDVVTETTDLPASLRLRHPATFDLADLNPRVSHNACTLAGVVCSGDEVRFPAGQTTVTWTAVDNAGNSSSATQYVNVKSPGSNRSPTAQGARADAISYEPITITLQAGDPDGDRLWFEIEEQPDGGFFHSPLYPYFIHDYRVANTAALDVSEFCAQEENRGEYVPTSWPVGARFMAVDDDGVVYVQDEGLLRCLDFEDGYTSDYRLAIFRPDGTWEQAPSSFDVKDMQVDLENDILYTSRHNVGGTFSLVRLFDLDLNPIATYRTDDAQPQGFGEPKNVAIDYDQSLLYVTDGHQYTGSATLWLMELPPPGDDPGEHLEPRFVAEYVAPGSGPDAWQDLALDSAGNLYASERDGDRIYKWRAATRHQDGTVAPGDFVGWMGRCDEGPGCDEANGRSFGYSCRDADGDAPATCTVSETGGDLPGQFEFPRAIAVGPNDILYVTDYGNRRVQRFTPEGFFAGQAISECDGSCFVLGDFGLPEQVTVNSSHFYVLDDNEELLHVFETTPITRLTDDTAEMVYQSDNNFVGADSFSYRVTDGLDESAPATVSLDVTRNYRPPTAIGPLEVITLEDTQVQLPVDGYDPDAHLDTLTFEAVDPPVNGSFVRQGDNYFYRPDLNFEGTETFSYAAYDGVFYSPAQSVTVEVTPVNDPPVLTEDESAGGQSAVPGLPRGFIVRNASGYSGLGRLAPLGTAEDPLRVGVGFRTTFNVIWEDPDVSDRHMVVVHWGDGTGSEQEGELLDDGTITGPVLSEGQGGGTGTVTAEHVFANAGNFTVEVCVSDQVAVDGDGNKSLTPDSITRCLPIAVSVAPMVDLLADIRPSANPYPAGGPLSYDLVVTNNAPESGDGLTATGLRVVDTLDTRLVAGNVTVDDGGSCSANGYQVTCTLDPLAPGESLTVTIPAQAGSALQPGMVLGNHLSFEVDQENQVDVQENGDLVTMVAPADFVVNTFSDEDDAHPGDGQCATAGGGCSLRAAIDEANNGPPGLRTISLADWQIMVEAELPVRYDVAITGLGAGDTVIAGLGNSRLFSVAAGGSLTLNGLSLQDGSTEELGGAIYNAGTATLTGVQVSGNFADGGGGAIYNTGTLTLTDSAVTGNEAVEGVGGIYNGATLRLENVTISGNRGLNGGLVSTGEMSLENVTVARNHGSGPGGLLATPNTSVTLRNTIVAGNSTDGLERSADCWGTLTSQGYNLLGAGCGEGAVATDITGRLPELLPLERGANNTMAHPLRGGSPAIDAGACVLAADQHGAQRPLDGDLDGNPVCDIGAVEFQPYRTWLTTITR